MTIVEFLNARLDEDEAGWRSHIRHEATQLRFFGQPLAERMLADIAAKRRIVELHDGGHECSQYNHHGEIDNCSYSHDFEDCSTLRLLASAYCDHPDYDPAWEVGAAGERQEQ